MEARLTIAAVAAAVLAAAPAQADTLASFPWAFGGVGGTNAEVTVWLGPTNDVNDPGHVFVGDGLTLFSLGDAPGTSFVLDLSGDPDFATIEASFTDGAAPAPDFWGVHGDILGGGSSSLFSSSAECPFIGSLPSGSCVGAVDLAGYDLQSIVLTLLSTAPFGADGVWLELRVDFEGVVIPEPTTGLLVGVGLALLGLRRQR